MSTLALCFSPETKSVSTYSNYNFTGSHRFKGKTLFIGSGGLFEYGGTTDNGTAIAPSLKTGLMHEIAGRNGLVRSQQLKRIPESRIDVSARTDGKIKVTVTADEASYTYTHDHTTTANSFRTHPVKIGRGIKFNAIQLNVESTDATILDIDAIRYNVTENQRRERG